MTGKRDTSRLKKLISSRKRRWLMIIVIIVVILVAGLGIYHRNHRQDNTADKYNILQVTAPGDFTLTGKIAPVQTQILNLPAGKLQQLNVKNGDHVTQGQALLTMHNDNTQDSVADLQADLGRSQRAMNTQQQTINNIRQQMGKMSSGDEGYSDLQSQLTEAQSAYADAQASVNATQQRLNTTAGKVNQTVTAPFAGYVTVDQTKQDAPVVTLYSDTLQFVGQVSEYDYAKFHQGSNLRVKALATNRTENTEVSYLAVVPTKSTGNNTKYEVTANVNGSKFMAGQTAKAMLKQDEVQIPASAVRHGKVFVVDKNGRARAVQVSGHAVNSYYVVSDGLVQGDRIVTNPNHQLKNNMRVDHDD